MLQITFGSQNDEMIKLAYTEALFDLLINGNSSREANVRRTVEKLDILYGPGISVDYKGGISGIFNR